MIENSFREKFGRSPDVSQFTPGRVNLIGEHTDYNGGMVLPTALELGLTIALRQRADDEINLHSNKFDAIAKRQISDSAAGHWSDYVTGAMASARQSGLIAYGADIAIETTLPFGAGLSSSAAVTVGILKICREISGADLSDTDIAVMARRVENEFIGVPCGIMDQMAVAISRPGQALALDTDSLTYTLIDLPKDYHMAVIHSGQFRALSEGRYKIRKEECDVVKEFLGRDDICRMTDIEFDTLSALPEHIQRRAKHCVSEHRRALQAAKLLAQDDIQKFGLLMSESHISQRDDFEISLPAVDALVDDAVQYGALGARQTGGGFGGCIVACIPKERRAEWQEELLAQHPDAFAVC